MGLYLVLAFWALCLWALVCNAKTGRDRKKLIAFVFSTNEWKDRSRECLDYVAYEDHLLALILLRDPWLLYPSYVREWAKAVLP